MHTELAALELATLGSLGTELAGLGALGATALLLHTGLAMTLTAVHTGLAVTTALVLHTGLTMTMTAACTGLLSKLVGIAFYECVASSDSFLCADGTVIVGVNRSTGNRGGCRSGSNLRSGALSKYRHRSGEQEEYGFLHILYCGLC